MDDGPWLYYNLTNEPKGSGELLKSANITVSIQAVSAKFSLRWPTLSILTELHCYCQYDVEWF